MDDFEIRPTTKFVRAAAILIGVLVLAAWGALVFEELPSIWIPVAVTLLLLSPLYHWLRIQTNLTVLTTDRLRSESGVLSRSTRNLMLSRIQDVGVFQSFWNRIFDVGDIWIETAGASSRVYLHSIDSPREVADKILERARAGF